MQGRGDGERYRFGAFEVDVREKNLRKHGSRVKLQAQPFLVLTRLLENPDKLVTREELRRELWPEDTFVDFEHSLNEAVNKVRVALGDSASSPRFIETVPRHGYRFIAPVDKVEQVESPPAAPAATEIAERRRRPVPILAASGLVAAGLIAFWILRSTGSGGGVPIRSLAVLPLENLSRDPAQEYFSSGLTDELTSQLSRIGELRVISRTSARRYKDSAKSLREIGRELGVDALVEGSVRLAEERVRITVQLVDAESDRSLWSGSYEGRTDDVLDIQNRVALAIAEELRTELSAGDAAAIAAREVSPEAFRAYLKGRHHWNQRTEKDFLKAIEYFTEATTLDPGYAEAFTGLADTYNLLSVYNLQRPKRAMPRAMESARKALAIDPGLAQAHASFGCILFLYDWSWQEAEREFQKAIEIDPNHATSHQWYGVYLMAANRPQEGLETIGRALALDPLSLSMNENLGWAFYVARRYPEAIEQFQKTLELDPEFGPALRYLGLTYLYLGRHEEALSSLEKARHKLGEEPEVRADLALAHALAGRREEAESLLRTLMEASDERYVSPFLIASFHVGLGNLDQALDWLEKAQEERVANLVFLGVDPSFDPLRAHPRFQSLLQRLGLSL